MPIPLDMSKLGMVAVGSPAGDEWLELAVTPKGRIFRKQILRLGDMAHPNIPGAKLHITNDTFDSLIRNFNAKTCDIVQVPIVDDKNTHVEDPKRNLGQVIDLEKRDGKLYAIIDARKPQEAEELGNTLIGASALMHMNYKNTTTGELSGPTLLHVAVTNRPYVTDLEDYEEIIAASADNTGNEGLVVFTPSDDDEEPVEMELEEMLAELKDKHGIDVAALQASQGSDNSELVEALSNVLGAAGAVGLSNDKQPTVGDVADAVIELSQEKVALAATVDTLTEKLEAQEEERRTAEVDRLVTEGKILPVKRDAMLKLSRSDHDLFLEMVPDDAVVAMSEAGVTTHDAPVDEKLQAEIERLSAAASKV